MRTFPSESFGQDGPRGPKTRDTLINKRAFFQNLTDQNRKEARLYGPGLKPTFANNLVVLIPKMAVRRSYAILIGKTIMERGVQIALFMALPAPEDEDAYQRYCDPHLENGWVGFILDRNLQLLSHPWDFGAPEESLRRVFEQSLDPKVVPDWLDRLAKGRCRFQALPR